MMGKSSYAKTHALVRGVPNSLKTNGLTSKTSYLPLNIERARHQHKTYTDILKSCGITVISLPADEKYPDSVFIEDTAIIIGDKAVITRPGHPSRRGEVDDVKLALSNLNINTYVIDDDDATMDGGDVLFTGKEILVGLSSRTNEAAISHLKRAFPEFDVTAICVKDILHLKSSSSMAGENTIAIGNSTVSKNIRKEIEKKSRFKYDFLCLDNDAAANLVYFNGQLLHKTLQEIGTSSYDMLKNQTSCHLHELCMDEFYKVDGCLTCSSILFAI